MALLNIIDQNSQEIDNKNFSIGIFLDLSNAFDTIDCHYLLLKNLKYMVFEVMHYIGFQVTFLIDPNVLALMVYYPILKS